jgi:exonuclease VII small subunit
LAVREWDLILQQWTDKKAILMCNYAVESVNEFATVIERANLTLRHHSPQMIQELRKRLENAEKVIQQALQTKVSEQTRQHLNKMLNETHELITRIPPTPANAQDIHTRNHYTILNPRKSNVSKAFASGGRFINMADRHGRLVAEEAMASLGLVLAGLERAAELPRHEQIQLFQKLSDHLDAVENQILNALNEDGLSEHVRQRLLQSLEGVRNLRAKVPEVSTVDYIFAPFESCVVELVKRIVFAFFLILVGGLISLILSLFESCSK